MDLRPVRGLVAGEFAPEVIYLDTSSYGLVPRRTVQAVRARLERDAAGMHDRGREGVLEPFENARACFGRLAGVPADRVAVGTSVAVHVAVVAASLPVGSEVLLPHGEFASLVMPFHTRGGLRVRCAPLEDLGAAVRPQTALVAWSAVQSSDGRIADSTTIRAAAVAHNARTLVDMSQSAGWLPEQAGLYDYTVTGAYKYLLSPRGTSFLTVTEEAQEHTAPVQAGWMAAADTAHATYGHVPTLRLARSARRFDASPPFLSYEGAAQSMALIESIGTDTVRAHITALADLLRAGLTALGMPSVAAPGSAIVAVPRLGDLAKPLAAAGIRVAERAGNLRVSFHVYNSADDVEALLEALARLRAS